VEKQIQAMFCTVASKVKMISAHHRIGEGAADILTMVWVWSA
jgi:hypothetical protein